MNSRRKLIIILLSIVVVGLVLVYGAIVLMQPNQEGEGGFIRDFLPFGAPAENYPEDFQTPLTDIDSDFEGDSNTAPIYNQSAELNQVTTTPSSPGFIYSNDEATFVRFISKEDGVVYDTNLETGERAAVTTDSLSEFNRVVWANRNSAAVQSYENGVISTALISINESSESLSSTRLEDDIEQIETYGTSFVYIKGNQIKTSAGSVLYTLPISGWSISSDGTVIYTYPKASSGVESPLYRVTQSGLEKITSGFGLVAENDSIVSTNASLRDTTLSTIADKCVSDDDFAYCAVPQSIPSGTYPDDWYKGVVSFSDALWVIDTTTNGVRRLQTTPSLDGTELYISDGYLSFVDKKTDTLWVYRVETQTSIEEGGGLLPPPLAF